VSQLEAAQTERHNNVHKLCILHVCIFNLCIGGHGPFVNALGLGVDNILEVDLVVANGSLVTANQKQNTDLFFALRGGGGSTFGVITKITGD